ncbi:hypothetical protein RSAG8_02053, partial [Rhizoctonia solani AG-8 WAC10335]
MISGGGLGSNSTVPGALVPL